jgi:hypothetical protein
MDVFAELIGQPNEGQSAQLYKNLGGGAFKNVTNEVGFGHAVWMMGGNFGDLENTGYEDIYIGTGGQDLGDLMPNLMYRNAGGERFEDVTEAGGFGNLQKGHGIAFADLDNDGRQEVFSQLGGFVPSDRSVPNVFKGPPNKNHWLVLRLKGVKSNRAAIGSRVHVEALENGKPRHIYRMVSSGGSYGSNSLQVHVGLGSATKIAKVEITWAGSLTHDEFKDVGIDQFLEVTEGAKKLKRLDLKPIALGQGAAPRHHHH